MSLKNDLKLLWRSGSLGFVRDKKKSEGRGVFQYRGRPVHYRAGTSDMTLIHDILLYKGPKAEYWLPDVVAPRTILDLGANIGLTAIYYANRFPQAVIHAVEPLPANYELLVENTRPYANVTTHNLALGAQDGHMPMRLSARPGNFGGASLYGVDASPEQTVDVPVRDAAAFCRDIGLDRVDLIKIDTEGAEYDILTALEPNLLFRVRWIIGELHGVHDFKLLDYLTPAFLIDVRKTLHKTYFLFNACNTEIVDLVPKHQVKWLQY
jgi:FkbM family methyltransferase